MDWSTFILSRSDEKARLSICPFTINNSKDGKPKACRGAECMAWISVENDEHLGTCILVMNCKNGI